MFLLTYTLQLLLAHVSAATCLDWPKLLGGANGRVFFHTISVNYKHDMLVVGGDHYEEDFGFTLITDILNDGVPFVALLAI